MIQILHELNPAQSKSCTIQILHDPNFYSIYLIYCPPLTISFLIGHWMPGFFNSKLDIARSWFGVSFNLHIIICCTLGWFKNPVSCQTDKLMAGTKFSGYLGLKHYKKANKLKHFIHLRLAQRPQSLSTYHSISPTVNPGHRLKKYVPVM